MESKHFFQERILKGSWVGGKWGKYLLVGAVETLCTGDTALLITGMWALVWGVPINSVPFATGHWFLVLFH